MGKLFFSPLGLVWHLVESSRQRSSRKGLAKQVDQRLRDQNECQEETCLPVDCPPAPCTAKDCIELASSVTSNREQL